MRFEYYHKGLDDVPKLSIDGTVDNAIHFSHWAGNQTHASLRADTSTEIALNLVASPDRDELTRGITLVTNNHFDTDGLLSVWTVLTGERALDLREKLIAAAEAGDFSEYTNEQAIRASIVIQGMDEAVPDGGVVSPLARQLAAGSDGAAVTVDEARAYELLLPEVERVLTRTDDYEPLWREGWNEVVASMESFARGGSRVYEDERTRISIITLAPDLSANGFKPTRHVPPYTAISHHARGEVYLIGIPVAGGWAYRVDYPYYSWAETFVRPRIRRRDFAPVVARLNELENASTHEGRWKLDRSELTSALKFGDEHGALGVSTLAPEAVAEEMGKAVVSSQ
ncbi:MAG TPA: DUF6687 family protein [Pyrinomonadaceae bacterium]|jgi:hypothetical protein